MHIRNSTYADLPRILEIYAQARRFMAEQGNPNQWGRLGWPPEDMIRRDIDTARGFVCEENGEVLGVFYFEQGHRIDPTYACIEDGAWIGDDHYGVVHRIASARKGVGTFCIEWAFAQCGHLRIDTHADNAPMQKLLKKLGFTYCGTIYVGVDPDPRLAYEKIAGR